ncbi:MAG: acyl-CoA thioesterase, partial [Actinomycetia bacterium]|nr:acyl-CoA thioesterase [Actinomycetes bacterium]
ELDPYRHLNHSVYIQYFETGRIDLFKDMGWSLTQMCDLGTQIVVVSIETRFMAPGVENDELIVESWVDEVKRVSMKFGQRIMRGDEVLATQKVLGACTSLDGRPKRIPDELLTGLSGFENTLP